MYSLDWAQLTVEVTSYTGMRQPTNVVISLSWGCCVVAGVNRSLSGPFFGAQHEPT